MISTRNLSSVAFVFAIVTLAWAAPAPAQQPSAGTTTDTSGNPMHPATPGTATSPDMPMAAMSSPAAMANRAATNKMNQAMDASSMTGDPDRDFVGMMMPHHQGAIDMAKIELKYGKDPVLRRMATAIVAAQQKEIAEMGAWEAKHPSP